MPTKPFDSAIVGTAEQAVDFIGNILESSTEYSIIGKDLDTCDMDSQHRFPPPASGTTSFGDSAAG